MKPIYFIFSESQREWCKRSDCNINNRVFIDGKFIPYTEMNSTSKSNWADAKCLGVAPEWWIEINGVIQDQDLKKFLYGNNQP